MAVRGPIPHTAHFRDLSTGSIGYSYETRPTSRLLPWAILPTHCTTCTQLTIIDIRPATVKVECTARGFATTKLATHLNLNHGIPIIRLSQLGRYIDPAESLANFRRRSPCGWQHWELNPGPHEWEQRFLALRYSATYSVVALNFVKCMISDHFDTGLFLNVVVQLGKGPTSGPPFEQAQLLRGLYFRVFSNATT